MKWKQKCLVVNILPLVDIHMGHLKCGSVTQTISASCLSAGDEDSY